AGRRGRALHVPRPRGRARRRANRPGRRDADPPGSRRPRPRRPEPPRRRRTRRPRRARLRRPLALLADGTRSLRGRDRLGRRLPRRASRRGVERSVNDLFSLVLRVHILAAVLCTITFWIPVSTPKG